MRLCPQTVIKKSSLSRSERIAYRTGLTKFAMVLGLFTLCAVAACKRTPVSAPAPPEVTVAQPTVQNVTDYITFTGNTVATDSVNLVARVEGYLDQLHFTDGARVKKGDLLFTIQQEQYKAQLQQAQAQLTTQMAALWHAKTEFARYTNLLKQDAATQTEVDHWRYEREAATAGVSGAQAQIVIAKLNLSYTLVRAPFDGRLGRHLIDPGNLVGAMGQQTVLAEIDRLDPMYIYFTIDERDLLRIAKRARANSHLPISQQPVPINFGVMNEEGYPRTGTLDFASLTLAPTTGTLQLRATIPNSDLSLLPGLFVRVQVPTIERRGALILPGDSISFDQQGEYVLVVNDKNMVERRSVKSGAQIGDNLVIEQGLKPEDWVVVEGMLQAIPGREVNPQRTTTPVASPPKTSSAGD
jgi:RND family efflux transporter MFP subunit